MFDRGRVIPEMPKHWRRDAIGPLERGAFQLDGGKKAYAFVFRALSHLLEGMRVFAQQAPGQFTGGLVDLEVRGGGEGVAEAPLQR